MLQRYLNDNYSVVSYMEQDILDQSLTPDNYSVVQYME
jgi:hypothetical protein